MGITHTKVTVIADDPNYDVGADEWNDDHVVTASDIPIVDTGSLITATEVEGALAELATEVFADVFVGPFHPLGFTQTGAMTAANFAFLSPFEVHRSIARTGARTYISVQSGNIDIGIYNAAGTRIASTGSIACPATGEQTVAFTGSVTLDPGERYYLAFAADNTSVATAIRHGIINTSGYIGIGALPLPATLVPPGTGTIENWMWVLT